jgi:hypothetical protein
MRAQQLAEQRSVAAPGILAITANRKIRLLAESPQGRDDALRLGTSHLAQIPLRVRSPARVGPRLRLRIRNQFPARCHFRQPYVEEVPLCVILFPDAARQQPHGAEAKPLPARARCTKSHDLNHLRRSTVAMTSAVTSSLMRSPLAELFLNCI